MSSDGNVRTKKLYYFIVINSCGISTFYSNEMADRGSLGRGGAGL